MNFKFFTNTFRFLKINWVFTLINVAGLAFGFACAILIFLHINKEYSYNETIPGHEDVYFLLQKSPDSPLGNSTISYALSPLLAQKFPEIESVSRTENYSNFSNCIVTFNDTNEILSFNELSFYLADNGFFNIIKYPFVEGARETALNSPNSIVLTDETSKKYFGDESALGKNLTLNGKHHFTVSGVVKIPDYVSLHFSMVVPMTTMRSEKKLAGWNSNGRSLIQLQKGTDYNAFNKKIERFYSNFMPEIVRNPDQVTLNVMPISKIRLYYNSNPLYLLIFIGFVILVVSILNYVNMFTSLMQKRKSEIALKKISGANGKTIGRQFMQETFVICFFAVLLGVFVSILGIPVFRNITGSDVLPYLNNNVTLFVASSVIIWIIISVAAGFYPSLLLAGVEPLELIGKGSKNKISSKGKSVLITAQFVVSILLIIITLMVDRQYRHMAEMPLGFENEFVMQMPLTNKLKSNFRNLKNSLKENSKVKDVCIASAMPAGIPNHDGVEWINDQNEKMNVSFGFTIASDGYTQTFNMKMIEGNEFTFERPNEFKGVIINETAVRHLGFEQPIGKQVKFWGVQSPIIGVVKDFQNNFLFNEVKPMVISANPNNQGFTKYIYVSLMPGDINRTINEIEKTLKDISPEYPFEYSFTNIEVENYIFEIKQIGNTFKFASIGSIFLALIGLMALTYQTTQARIKEIGIRKVNGARSIEVLSLLNKVFLKWILIAFIIASPIGWLIIFNLQKGIANKADFTWWVFAVSGLSVALIALLLVSIQSLRAANSNPIEALRCE